VPSLSKTSYYRHLSQLQPCWIKFKIGKNQIFKILNFEFLIFCQNQCFFQQGYNQSLHFTEEFFFDYLYSVLYLLFLLSLKAQEVCGSFESDAMIDSIKMLDKELIEVKQAALSSTLKPLPGETVIFHQYYFCWYWC
jgi:hypothetical protein